MNSEKTQTEQPTQGEKVKAPERSAFVAMNYGIIECSKRSIFSPEKVIGKPKEASFSAGDIFRWDSVKEGYRVNGNNGPVIPVDVAEKLPSENFVRVCVTADGDVSIPSDVQDRIKKSQEEKARKSSPFTDFLREKLSEIKSTLDRADKNGDAIPKESIWRQKRVDKLTKAIESDLFDDRSVAEMKKEAAKHTAWIEKKKVKSESNETPGGSMGDILKDILSRN